MERIYLRQRCFDGSVNKTILKPRLAAEAGRANTYTWHFSDVNFLAYTMSEKAIPFRHPDYNPDQAQKLISSSMSRHLSTRNISSKSMHTFLSNLANRQTDRQTRAKTFTSSFVVGNEFTAQSDNRSNNCSCFTCFVALSHARARFSDRRCVCLSVRPSVCLSDTRWY